MHVVYVIALGGGPEAYVRTITSELKRRGHRSSVVCTVPPARANIAFPMAARIVFAPPSSAHYYLAKTVGNLRIWPLRLRAWETARAVLGALKEIDKVEPIDLVEVTEGTPITSIRIRWPTLVRAHGSAGTFFYFCHDGDSRVLPWLISMEATELHEAMHVIPLSQHLANHLSGVYHLPRERIKVIPYPIDVDDFCPANDLKVSVQESSLLTVGRLERRKGVDTLFRALAAKVWPCFPNLKSYFLGNEGDLKRVALADLVPDNKRAQVIFPGFMNRQQIPHYYQNATIYVAPSRYETFGYSILEAMACGRAVVSTQVGAVPELVEDGVTGLLVPVDDHYALADAINSLLSDRERRERMGQRAREKAMAEYSTEKVMPQMISVYGELSGLRNLSDRQA